MTPNRMYVVFRDEYLDAAVAAVTTSAPFPMEGNKVVMAINVANISTGNVSFRLEGSYDGLAWIKMGTGITATAFGYDDEPIATVDVAFVRVLATAASSAKARFDTTLVMSSQ